MTGLASGDVKSVTYRCNGTDYAAEMIGSLVVFVAPDGAMTLDQCEQIATLADGESVRTPL